MTFLLAISSGVVLIITFIAERIIKFSAAKQLDRTAKPTVAETNEQTLKNLVVVSRRNRYLTNLSLSAFAALALIQIFSIIDASDNETKKNMDDIQNINTRVAKIEHYLWGDGGSKVEGPPTGPTDLADRLQLLEERLRANQTDTNANANSLKEAVLEMRAEIEQLKEQVKASRGKKLPAHTR